MRALLIGVGGAGCRIAETIMLHDVESGVRSVRSYIFDCDRAYINSIATYDYAHKIVLTPVDPVKSNNDRGTDFDVSHLADCFQDASVDEVDAVFVCAGLGGRMAELVPEFLRQLNETSPDPVFTILTLPGRNEGARVSARASETLAQIRKVSSANLIFDNETWMQRLEDAGHHKIGASTPIQSYYGQLNDYLSRQISLLLRAGEFGETGVDSAEVVLDAGEVLNTLSGMDLVAIGYALEKLPVVKSGFFHKAKMEKYLLDEGHQRTARIVELAKRAVYEDISVPCDLTSANKALILIAGPSSELSMKGFQTVRKWIDRSIKGLEMRAGDYPVPSTKYVGVIVVLAGIENVPRITELQEISQSYKSEQYKTYTDCSGFDESDIPQIGEIAVAKDETIFEPELIAPVQPLSTIEDEPEKYFEEEEEDIFDDVPKKAVPSPSPAPAYTAAISYAAAQAYSHGAEQNTPDEDLFGDIRQEKPVSSVSDDFWEIPYQKPQERPAPSYESASSRPVSADPFADAVRSADVSKASAAEPALRKKDPQIVIAGTKKVEKIDNTIMLPKREKKVDTVLSGQANIGGNDKPKETDSMDISGLGSRKRPKETEFSGVLEGSVKTAGTPQRPKETDGFIRLGATQRPKETEGFIRMSELKRPKETDGFIKVGGVQRPKEIEGGIRAGSAQRPNDSQRAVRVTTIPLPKNLGADELKVKAAPVKKKNY
ncbi:MAG TPA: tubulin/FtsZ family protein [Methanocorpusculum sp.]|nr:tubulin/FtsZ family protein [Methanocorpusculum sp.]